MNALKNVAIALDEGSDAVRALLTEWVRFSRAEASADRETAANLTARAACFDDQADRFQQLLEFDAVIDDDGDTGLHGVFRLAVAERDLRMQRIAEAWQSSHGMTAARHDEHREAAERRQAHLDAHRAATADADQVAAGYTRLRLAVDASDQVAAATLARPGSDPFGTGCLARAAAIITDHTTPGGNQ